MTYKEKLSKKHKKLRQLNTKPFRNKAFASYEGDSILIEVSFYQFACNIAVNTVKNGFEGKLVTDEKLINEIYEANEDKIDKMFRG